MQGISPFGVPVPVHMTFERCVLGGMGDSMVLQMHVRKVMSHLSENNIHPLFFLQSNRKECSGVAIVITPGSIISLIDC